METKRMWEDKPYYSLNNYLKKTFSSKVYKISLNAGMTCPNRDGTIDTRGCIFCSKGGSGDFATDANLSITKQIEVGKKLVENKINSKAKYIAYFQAYTNTYAPVSYLKRIFTEAINHPDIVALSIGTRPDCLPTEVLELLEELNLYKPVWIELGLQTIHQKTANYIRRGYSLDCFENAVNALNIRKISIIVHVIIGLPFETPDDILATVKYLAHQNIQGIKLQLLHVLKDTDLEKDIDLIPTLTLENYANLICKCISILPQNIVIHRITGDGPKSLLIAPLWSSNKKHVLNTIHHIMKENDVWQGKLYN